jgi:hypothetical protein
MDRLVAVTNKYPLRYTAGMNERMFQHAHMTVQS